MRFFLILGFLFFSAVNAMDKLPEPMPDDIKIIYYKSLGHGGHGFSMEITSKNCKYIDNFIRRKNEFSFNIGSEELLSIYQVLQKNKVHKIEYDDGFIHDYDGISLSVSWGTKSIDISQSGRMIKSNWKEEWENIVTPLEKIRERELEGAVKEMEIILDKSLYGNFIHIQVDSIGFVLREYIDEKYVKQNYIKFKMLPGVHSVFCVLYKGYDLKRKKEIYSDYDPARPSVWDMKHGQYIDSLKSQMFDLSLDSSSKKSFHLMKKKDALVIQ